jgi:hypothetical protein
MTGHGRGRRTRIAQFARKLAKPSVGFAIMGTMKRIASVTAIAAALLFAACGSDNQSGSGAEAQSTTQRTTTTTIHSTTTSPTTTPTAPQSATIPSSGAPDSGISTRPGGPSGGGY